MSNNTREFILRIKNHTIRPRRTAIIDLARVQNRKLIVRAGDGEVEVLVVVVFMGVVIDVVVCGVEVETGVLSVGDCGFCVTVGGTGVGAGAGIVLFYWDYGGEGEWC